jgi:DNA-binding NarL/FixJ family response regulator
LIADDQAVVRMGYRAVLDSAPDIEVVGEAGDARIAVESATELRPDLVLMDIRMPGGGGIEATRRIAALPGAPVRVLMVTSFDVDEWIFASLRAGASGFILKDIQPEELVRAVRTVHAGDSLLAPAVTSRLIAEYVRCVPPATPETDPDPAHTADLAMLTAREREVITLVAAGLSNAEIAAQLYLATSTVKTHVSAVLAKWNLRDRAQLVVHAFETGLAEIRGPRR